MASNWNSISHQHKALTLAVTISNSPLIVMRLISTTILTLLLFGCSSPDTGANRITIEDPEHHIKDSPDILSHDSILYTGWYFIKDSSNSYKRKMMNTSHILNIDPTPIVTAENFDKVTMFHEKDCFSLLIWLDATGSRNLNAAIKKYKGKKIVFLLDNKPLQVQDVDDPQFAMVEDDSDKRTYGQILALPCNSYPPDALENYKTIIESER